MQVESIEPPPPLSAAAYAVTCAASEGSGGSGGGACVRPASMPGTSSAAAASGEEYVVTLAQGTGVATADASRSGTEATTSLGVKNHGLDRHGFGKRRVVKILRVKPVRPRAERVTVKCDLCLVLWWNVEVGRRCHQPPFSTEYTVTALSCALPYQLYALP